MFQTKDNVFSSIHWWDVVENSPYSTWLLDDKGTCLNLNTACRELFGVSEGDAVVGRYNIFQDKELQRNGVIPEIRKVFENGEIARFNIDYDASKLEHVSIPNGIHKILDMTIYPIIENGKVINAVIQHIDMTQIKISEEELAESNKNLQQFAYVASHDLKEPLRVVSNYCDLLAKKYHNKLDKEADKFIVYIIDAIARMKKLIDDLLEFSKLQNGEASKVPIDLNNVMNELMDVFSVRIEETRAQIKWDSMPIITGYPSQITRLIQNILSNAIKFRGDIVPVIKIQVFEEISRWYFKITDNGIGIKESDFDVIFLPFKRLYTDKKYTGTGIGLAICKKIIENHQGHIWVESHNRNGSTFHFTITKEHHE